MGVPVTTAALLVLALAKDIDLATPQYKVGVDASNGHQQRAGITRHCGASLGVGQEPQTIPHHIRVTVNLWQSAIKYKG